MSKSTTLNRYPEDIYADVPEWARPFVAGLVVQDIPADWNRSRVVEPILRDIATIDRMAARLDALPAEIEAAEERLRAARESLRQAEDAWDNEEEGATYADVLGARERVKRAADTLARLRRELDGTLGRSLDDQLREKRERLRATLMAPSGIRAQQLRDEYRSLQVRRGETAKYVAARAEAEKVRRAREEREAAIKAEQERHRADLGRYLGLNV